MPVEQLQELPATVFKDFCAGIFRQLSARLKDDSNLLSAPPQGGDVSAFTSERRCHFHLEPELFIQIDGATDFTVPSGTFRLAQGHACVIPRRTPHSEHAMDADDGTPFRNLVVLAGCGIISMHIATAKAGRPLVTQGWRRQLPTTERVNAFLDECADAILSSHRSAAETTRHAFAALLARFQIILDYPEESPQKNANWRINICKTLIANEIYDPELKVARLARSLSCTPNHLSGLFKIETDETLNAYITRKRIEKAKSLLRETTMNVSEVAWACGFSTPNYFIRSFKLNSGATPTRFRESTQ